MFNKYLSRAIFKSLPLPFKIILSALIIAGLALFFGGLIAFFVYGAANPVPKVEKAGELKVTRTIITETHTTVNISGEAVNSGGATAKNVAFSLRFILQDDSISEYCKIEIEDIPPGVTKNFEGTFTVPGQIRTYIEANYSFDVPKRLDDSFFFMLILGGFFGTFGAGVAYSIVGIVCFLKPVKETDSKKNDFSPTSVFYNTDTESMPIKGLRREYSSSNGFLAAKEVFDAACKDPFSEYLKRYYDELRPELWDLNILSKLRDGVFPEGKDVLCQTLKSYIGEKFEIGKVAEKGGEENDLYVFALKRFFHETVIYIADKSAVYIMPGISEWEIKVAQSAASFPELKEREFGFPCFCRILCYSMSPYEDDLYKAYERFSEAVEKGAKKAKHSRYEEFFASNEDMLIKGLSDLDFADALLKKGYFESADADKNDFYRTIRDAASRGTDAVTLTAAAEEVKVLISDAIEYFAGRYAHTGISYDYTDSHVSDFDAYDDAAKAGLTNEKTEFLFFCRAYTDGIINRGESLPEAYADFKEWLE